MEAASCSAFLRAFSFCSSLLARSSARLLALARASSGKKQYRSQDKDSNIVCSTKNKIAYSHGGVPFKPLTVSRYPTNCVPRLMKCCIRGCRKEKTTEKVQGIKKQKQNKKNTQKVARIFTSSKGGVAELPIKLCSSPSSILALFGSGARGLVIGGDVSKS